MPGHAGAAKPIDDLDHGAPGEPTRKLPAAPEPAKSQSQPTGANARHVKEVAGFEIISRLGEGGMGQVFKARQKSLDRFVALKVLTPKLAADHEYVQRFELEARAAAKLNHPNIVQVIEQGHDGVIKFIAFEFIDGSSLEGLLKKRGRIPEREALKIIREIADALRYSSEKGLIHRDVKPDNILLTKDGTPKLADLGLAKLQGDTAGLTQAGIVMGTPHYMAPEQALGERDLDVRADLYALGLVLYRCLVGELPWHSESALAILTKHINEDVPDPRNKVPEVTEACVTVLRGLTARERTDRYAQAVDVVRDVDAILGGTAPMGTGAAPRSGPALVATLVEPPRTKAANAVDPALTASGRRRPGGAANPSVTASGSRRPGGAANPSVTASGSRRPGTPPNPSATASGSRRAGLEKAASGRQAAPGAKVTTGSGSRAGRASGSLQHSMAITEATPLPRGAAMPLVLGLVVLALCSGAAVAFIYDRGKPGPHAPPVPSTLTPGPGSQEEETRPDTHEQAPPPSSQEKTPAPSTETDVKKVGEKPPAEKPPEKPPEKLPEKPPERTAAGIRPTTIEKVEAASAKVVSKPEEAEKGLIGVVGEIASDARLGEERRGAEAAVQMVRLVRALFATLGGGASGAEVAIQRNRIAGDLMKISDALEGGNELEAVVAREAHDWADAWKYLENLWIALLLDRSKETAYIEKTDPARLTGKGATSVLSAPWLTLVAKHMVPAVHAFDHREYEKALDELAKAKEIEKNHDAWPVYVETHAVVTALAKRLRGTDLSLMDVMEKQDPSVQKSAFVKARYMVLDFSGKNAFQLPKLPPGWSQGENGLMSPVLKPKIGGGNDAPLDIPWKQPGLYRFRMKLNCHNERHVDVIYVGAPGKEPSVAAAFVAHDPPFASADMGKIEDHVREFYSEIKTKEGNDRYPRGFSSGKTDTQDIFLIPDKTGTEFKAAGASHSAKVKIPALDAASIRIRAHNITIDSMYFEYHPFD
ncbi:protein kinase [bacterium]|nr:protein kinase [bacterium]